MTRSTHRELRWIESDHEANIGLQIKHDLTLSYVLSLTIVILMAAASLTGLLGSRIIYPTDVLFRAFVPNDFVNILIGLPILLGSLWLTQHSKLLGLLF